MTTGANMFLSPSVTRIKPREFAGEHKLSTLLSETNWQSWRDDIQLTFQVCDLLGYVTGQLKCLDKVADPIGENNWQYNDSYTKKVIWDCLSNGQKFYMANCDTARKMWVNLEVIHQSYGDQTENQLMRELFSTKAKDGDDIITHLATLTQAWDCITLVCQDEIPFSPKQFKKILAYTVHFQHRGMTSPTNSCTTQIRKTWCTCLYWRV